ncbi:MAG: maoC [Microbacteriaceae bacterium]|jgi:acyl dehydratase|nr:maoC [Microbacteriaceae bacterium]
MASDPRPALFLDNISVGDTVTTDEYVVTKQEIIEFATRYDPQVFHTDEEGAVDTFFGGLAASGWHTAAMTMRLLVTSGFAFSGGVVGAGGDISWPSATRAGDVLHVESTVAEITPSRSRPDRGTVTLRSETKTADGEIRQVLVARLVAFRKPA